jgi:hypothetical protein
MIYTEIVTVAPGNHMELKNILGTYMCVEAHIYNIKQGCSYNYHRQYSTDFAIIFIYVSRILSPRALAYMTV